MKKVIALLLAALMLLSAVACANGGDNTESTTAGNNQEETSAGEALGFEPTEYDKDIVFLTFDPNTEWTSVDIYTEGDSDDVFKAAVWARNVWVKDTFGVTVTQIAEADCSAKAKQQFQSGSGDYHAYVVSTDAAATLSTNGYLVNMLSDELPNLDLEKSWWDQKAVNGLSVGGKLYYATGDLLTIDNDGTFIMMFNKTLVDQKNLEVPYELVDNYEWTLAKCSEMMQTTCSDKNGNGQSDYDADSFGLAGGQEMVLGFFYGCGLTSVTKNEEDDVVYSLDSYIDKADEYFKWANTNLYNKDSTVIFHEVGAKSDFHDAMNCFIESRSLFYGECLQCVTRMRQYDVNFGIIPYPMYDTNQKAYYGYVNNVAQVVCVPTYCPDKEMTGSVLEGMAYKSKTTLTPAYYDINLIAKGTKDEESEPMLELVLANRIYDLGYVFGWGNGFVGGTFITLAKKGQGIASKAQTYKKAFEKTMNKTLDNYAKLN